jgi:hypothetical protein
VGQSTDGLPLSLEAISCHPFPPEAEGCGLRLKLSMPHWSKRQQSELTLPGRRSGAGSEMWTCAGSFLKRLHCPAGIPMLQRHARTRNAR